MSDKTLELVEHRCRLCALRPAEDGCNFCITCDYALHFAPLGEWLHYLGRALSIANLRDRAFFIDQLLFTYSPWPGPASYLLYLHEHGKLVLPPDLLSECELQAEEEAR